jgi:hypothetical protein
MFDRYFRLTVADEELSQVVVQRLLAARGNRDDLRSELESLHSRGLLNLAIEELGVYQDEIKPDQVEPYITAVFDIADLLSDDKRGMFEVPVYWRIGFLIKKSAEKLTDNAARSEVLTNAITKTKGLFMAAQFVALVDTPREGTTDESTLPEAEVVALRGAAVRKIESAAASGTLARHPKLALLLSIWRKWGNEADVAAYIEAITNTAEGTLQLLKSFVLRSLSQGMGDYIGTERYYMRRNDIETLIPMDTLDAKVQALPAELNDEDRRAVRAFQRAMERRRTGKSDDDPFAVDLKS